MRSSVFGADLGGDLRQDRLEVFLGDEVRDSAGQRLEVLDDRPPPGLASVVLLQHVADDLEGLAVDALRGKLPEQPGDELVLAGVVAKLELVDHLLRLELLDGLQRRQRAAPSIRLDRATPSSKALSTARASL